MATPDEREQEYRDERRWERANDHWERHLSSEEHRAGLCACEDDEEEEDDK